jgi:DNA-binding LacI/PurR family transcriptional regulator
MIKTMKDVRGARIGIDAVAAAAGVSRQTVSNVLNERGRFTPATRDRVLHEVRLLGYRPHRGAQSLRSRPTRLLAFSLSPGLLRPDNVVMAQFLQAVVAAADKRDHSVLMSAAGSDAVADLREIVAGAGVDAFIVADADPGDERLRYLYSAGIPFACFGRTAPDLPQCWVDIDNVSGIRSVVELVRELGHHRLAYLGYSGPGYWDDEREFGYVSGATAAGLPAARRTVHRVTDRTAHGVVDRLLGRRHPPTAVIASSDALAAVVYEVARNRSLRIGTDLAVTGFDGAAVGRSLFPTLTTVVIPLKEIAQAVVDRALAEFAGNAPGGPGLLVRGELLVGNSTRGGS